jgi:NAD(P)H-dependent flavin oxidoreductase YrpB (nitropropane dioxygenase family)
MLRTPFTTLLGIAHPIVQAGMGNATAPALVAAVSNAGALGVLGAGAMPDAQRLRAAIGEMRERTRAPFGVNLLLPFAQPEHVAVVLAERPAVLSLAWGDPAPLVGPAHEAGILVMYQATHVAEARAAAQAGVDILVAQGHEGGGHVAGRGVATLPLAPQVVDAVAPRPVLAAGGIVDGRGLAAALALGAAGVLMGTRFLATQEAPIAEGWKQRLLAASELEPETTEVYDLAAGLRWPGAVGRGLPNAFLETWRGREAELRARFGAWRAEMARARAEGRVDLMPLWAGQGVGLIRDLPTVAELVVRIVAEATAILSRRLPALVVGPPED